MGLLKNGVTILNFDETYFAQQELQKYPHENIDFQNMKHVNLYCEEDSLVTLNDYLKQRNQKGITFIGSGNYHYVTYLLLQEITEPFTLVLFDNHPDLGTEQDQNRNFLSCGSWVSYALRRVPLLRQVIIIGPTTITHQAIHPRVQIFSNIDRDTYSIKSILQSIQTQHVYISIDKDVLNTSEVVTNWDQGVMDCPSLIHYLDRILEEKQVEGVDVCGEVHLSPVETLRPDNQSIIQMNEKANLQILRECIKWNTKHWNEGTVPMLQVN